MPKLIDCEQKTREGFPTKEWLRARCGRITASRLGDVMAYSRQAKKEGAELKCRSDYRMELVSERLTGLTANHFVTNEMKWGAEQEELARTVYEQSRNLLVWPVGFAIHPTMDFSGASPDGLVGDEGGIEIKCLTTANHLDIFRSGKVPQEYYDQMQWNMVCCERKTWDFVIFDSRLPERLQMKAIPVAYDEERVAALEVEVRKMDAEVRATIEEFAPRKVVNA